MKEIYKARERKIEIKKRSKQNETTAVLKAKKPGVRTDT
jgi:hypothetical protein